MAAVGANSLGGMSTNTAGLEAISKTLAQFSDSNNISAISALNGQLAQLGKAMNISSLPVLIDQLEKLGKITSQQADELRKLQPQQSTFQKIGAGVKGFEGVMGRAGQALDGLAKTALLPLAAATNVYAAAADAAVQQIVRFVEKANPAAAFQFNRALDDLAGTIGQILTPVLQGITVFIRAFADGLQGLRPAFEPIMQGVSQTIQAFAPLMQALMQATGPAFQAVGYLLTNFVVPAIKSVADALTDFVKLIMRAVQELTQGAISFDEFQAKSSVGAAVRPAAYGKIEDIGKRTTLAALNQGSTDPAKDTARNTAKTNDLLEKMLAKMGKDLGVVKNGKVTNRSGIGIGTQFGKWIGKQLRDL